MGAYGSHFGMSAPHSSRIMVIPLAMPVTGGMPAFDVAQRVSHLHHRVRERALRPLAMFRLLSQFEGKHTR